MLIILAKVIEYLYKLNSFS